jgi:hypothetical protein
VTARTSYVRPEVTLSKQVEVLRTLSHPCQRTETYMMSPSRIPYRLLNNKLGPQRNTRVVRGKKRSVRHHLDAFTVPPLLTSSSYPLPILRISTPAAKPHITSFEALPTDMSVQNALQIQQAYAASARANAVHHKASDSGLSMSLH